MQGDLPNPGIEPGSSALQVDSLLSEPTGKPILPFKLALVLLKEISPEYSLEGLILKLKLQYFGHLM